MTRATCGLDESVEVALVGSLYEDSDEKVITQSKQQSKPGVQLNYQQLKAFFLSASHCYAPAPPIFSNRLVVPPLVFAVLVTYLSLH